MRHHLLQPKTLKFVETDRTIFKEMVFFETKEHLCLLIDQLTKAELISYSFIDFWVENSNRGSVLFVERKKLDGTPLDELEGYGPDVINAFMAMMNGLRKAMDAFEVFNLGFILTDYKELSNFILRPDGKIEPIDFEDSFIAVTDRAKFNDYWDLTLEHCKLELSRITALSEL